MISLAVFLQSFRTKSQGFSVYKICVCVLQDVFDHLQTPGNKPQHSEGAETPLSEVIERNLKAAVANSNRSHVMTLAALTASPQLGKEPEQNINKQVFVNFLSSFMCANTVRLNLK